MSAARLVAEAAFSKPQSVPLPADEPRITLRRTRVSAKREFTPAFRFADALPGKADHKSPRIFRIAASSGIDPRDADVPAKASTKTIAKADTTVLSPAFAQEALPPSRRKEAAANRRPGPVLQVFIAPAQQNAVTPSPEMLHESCPSTQLAVLVEKLARIDALLDEINRAQDFQVQIESSQEVWYGLSNAADRIDIQIQSWLACTLSA
jgi:hypothetical protein